MSSNVGRMLRAIKNTITGSTDAFGLQLADGTTNRGDLGSHFRYDPESYRLYRDGERELLQYDQTFRDTRATDAFDDSADTFTLTPAANERLTFQTATRFRYVVMYESEWSIAWEANRPLEGDEQIRITLDASAPKTVGQQHHGIEYDDEGVREFIERDGERVAERTVRNAEPVTSWRIYSNTFNWYNVGRKKGVEYYGDGEEQKRNDLRTVITDRSRGPAVGNGRITVDVQAGGASDLEVEVGSMGFRNLGQVTPKTRQKSFRVSETVDTADTWVPLTALRVDRDDFLVTTDLLAVDPISVPGDVDLATFAFDGAQTDASGWSFPPETNGFASALEFTTDITTIPDENGDEQTATDAPGGYQIDFGTSEVTGTGGNQRSVATVRERRRRIHDTDIAVVCARSESTGDIDFIVSSEQEK